MLIFLPLVTALATVPLSSNTYSTSEKRTLQYAISSVLQSQQLNRFYTACKEQPTTEFDTTITTWNNDNTRLEALLQEKLHNQDTKQLLSLDDKLTQQVNNSIVKPADCTDSKNLQTLIDNYELALFSLEIAQPLDRALKSKTASNNARDNAELQAAKQLIATSHAIAQVSVVAKQQLSPVQQANYLHPDYSGSYVFKVQQGWRSNVAQYLGMHIYVSNAEIKTTPEQWLIFLDKNGHFIKTLPQEEAGLHLKQLQQAEWRYDVHGNLHRN